MRIGLLITLGLSLIFVSCTSEKKIADTLKNNPSIIIEALEKDPGLFLDFLDRLSSKARELQASKREQQEAKELDERIEKPLVPEIRSDELIRGTKGAPIVLVEYSDFECPFCGRGYSTVMELLNQYKGKVQFIYKHLPLSFHQSAMITSKYYEALRLMNPDLAFKFHDAIYKDQSKLKNGEKYLQTVAKNIGADLKVLAETLKNKNSEIEKRIQSDMKEAEKFEMSGTPGFIINGIPVRGAYPKSHFESILKKLEEKGKISLK